MNASFGIDHPLLAIHDIEGLRRWLMALGFNMTLIGKHPWGTSSSLAMFDECLIEIMGIYDKTLIDEVPAGEFRFGRHVYEHLHMREGVALTALNSTHSQSDAEIASRAGFTVAGHLEFGRDVTLPNGTVGRTKTTLALLPDAPISAPVLLPVPTTPTQVDICARVVTASQQGHWNLRCTYRCRPRASRGYKKTF